MRWYEQVGNWSRPIGRVLLAIVVAYLFIVALLVSTAQQKVVEALNQQNVGYDYNVAIKYFFEPDKLENERAANLGRLTESSKKLAELEQRQAEAQRSVNLNYDVLFRALLAIPREACPLDLPASVKEESDKDMALAASLEVSACGERGAAVTQQMIDRVLNVPSQIEQSEFYYKTAALAVSDQRENKAQLEEARAALVKQGEMAAKSIEIMPVLDIFRNSRWPLVGPMVWVPPSLMAIFLAFTSGLFGALLITLVLFVYPEDKRFTFAKSKSYAGRILLGGLIALGVFVLLFSGVAVLGDNGSNGSTQNVMAYAAIGILSGMFSDQAAGWLSRQTHFGEEDERESKADRQSRPEQDEPA